MLYWNKMTEMRKKDRNTSFTITAFLIRAQIITD